MKLLLLVLLFTLINALNGCGGGMCSSDCLACSSMDICIVCCSHFGTQTVVETRTNNVTLADYNVTVTKCLHCSDPWCNSCSFTAAGFETCTSCMQGTGVVASNPWYCQSCSSSNAYVCQPVNNCDTASMWQMSCAYCNTYTFIAPDKCMPCNQAFRNCETCSSTQCTGCLSGYYMNYSNYKQCVPCTIQNCQSCTYGPVCWYCNSGYYKDSNNVCQRCSLPCYSCGWTNATQCTSCISNMYLLRNSSCIPCLDIGETPNCLTCYSSTSGNQTTYGCYSCLNNSYLLNSACTPCVSPCKTCSSSSYCYTCVDDTYYLRTSDNTCQLCSGAITHCTNCLTDTVCLACDLGYNVIFRSNTCTKCSDAFDSCTDCSETQCSVCMAGYVMTADFKCEMNLNCSSNCTSCETGFPSNCVICPAGYYVSNKVCLPCSSLCLTCTSSTDCILCHGNYYYSNSTCLPCPNRTYYLETARDCINCSQYCLSCSILGCDSCEPLFQVSQYDHQCADICGDGYIVFLACDAPIGIANDGCSDSCAIQQDYNCTYTNQSNPYTSNVTTVQISKCSFIGDVVISVSKASQAMFANQVELSFKIVPYLFGMPDGSEGQTFLKSIFSLSPFADYTISINPADQTVTFSIHYQVDISTVGLSLSVNYQNMTSNAMFQYMKNKQVSVNMNEIISVGRLGEFHEQGDYSLNKGIYAVCIVLVIISLLFLLLGLVSRQLAALQNMILYQTIFLLVVFQEGPSNFYLEGLIGLKYSTGFDFSEKSAVQLANNKFYNYGINTQSLLYQYNVHFFILLVPIIISFFFMMYRIKNKHLPVKNDFGKTVAEELIGYVLLYFIAFNFYGLLTYTYMYVQSSRQSQFWNFTVIGTSLLLTLFAWCNLGFRPEAVGSFRAAFGSYKNGYQVQQSKTEFVRKMESFFTWRIKGEQWKQSYPKFSVNFYFILLAYQILSAFCIALNYHLVLLGLQLIIFVLLFLTKPYLKIVENARSILMFFTLLFSNLITLVPIKGYPIVIILILLMLVHTVLTAFTTIKFARFEILKQCNERSKVVRQMFKEEENLTKVEALNHQMEVVNSLIEKYHQLNIQQKLPGYSPTKTQEKVEGKEVKEETQVKDEVSDNENMFTEQRILAQQNQHLRFLEGMQFYEKYGNQIDNQIIKQHYSQV